MLHGFTLTNTGTVTLRDVRLREASDITSVICQPSLGSPLPVGATMTCAGQRYMTFEDFDFGRIATTALFFARNILPIPDNPYINAGMPRQIFLQDAHLATPPLVRHGDLDAYVVTCGSRGFEGGLQS